MEIAHTLLILSSILFVLRALNDLNNGNKEAPKDRQRREMLYTSLSLIAPLLLLATKRSLLASAKILPFLTAFYAILFLDALEAWWIPYIVEDPSKQYPESAEYFKKVHGYTPLKRIILNPTALHAIIHVLTLACLGLAYTLSR